MDVEIIKSMTANEMIKDAIVLLNLAHSYLDCSLTNSENKNENDISEKKNQTDRTNEFQEASKEFSENLQQNIAKKIPVLSDKQVKHEGKKKRLESKKTKIKKSCNKDKKQFVKGAEINVDLKIQVDSDFQRALSGNVPGKKQTLEDIEIELSLEVLDNDPVIQLNDRFEQEIEGLVDDVLCGKKQINEVVRNKFSNKAQLVLENKVQKQIEDIQRKFDDIKQEHDEKLEKKIIDKMREIYPFSGKKLFVEEVFKSLQQACAPYYEQIEQISNFYFPNMCTLRQNCNDEMHLDSERKRNEEVLQLLDRVIKENVNIDEIHVLDQDIKLVYNSIDKKKNDKIVKLDSEIVKDIIERNLKKIEKDKSVDDNVKEETRLLEEEAQDKVEEKSVEELCQNFDMVIQLNREIHQNVDGQTQNAVKETVNIILNEELMKRFNEGEQYHIDNIVEQLSKKDVQFKIIKKLEARTKVQDVQIEEMDVDSNREMQIKAEKQTQKPVLDFGVQKEDEKQLHLQLEFYRHLQGNKAGLIQEKFENKVQEYSSTNVDTFKSELLKKSETDEFNLEIVEENDGDIELFDDNFQSEFDTDTENFDVNIEDDFTPEPKLAIDNTIAHIYKETPIEDELETKEFGCDIEEELEVDIEGYDSDICFKFVDENEKFERDIHEESDVNVDDNINDLLESEQNIENNLNLTQIYEKTQLENEIGFEEFVRDVQEEFEEKIEENDGKIHYKFDVESEKCKEIILEEFYVNTDNDENEILLKPEPETAKFDTNIQEESEMKIEGCNDEMSVKMIDGVFKFGEHHSHMRKIEDTEPQLDHEEVVQQGLDEDVQETIEEENKYFNEINEVTEVIEEVEDTDTESISVVGSISTEEVYIASEEKSFSSEEESFSTDEEFTLTEKEPIFLENDSSFLDHELFATDELFSTDEEEFKELLRENFKEENAKFNKNKKKFDDEKSKDKELSQQLKNYQKEFYLNLKKEYDKELNSQVNKHNNPIASQVCQEQQQQFLKLRDEFKEIKEDYENCIHNKFFKDLNQATDKQNLLGIKDFPEKNDERPHFKIDESIFSEIADLQNEFNDLKPEFSCNVPVENDEEIPKPPQKPFNLFEKLYSIHKQKLCSIVDSKQWPENSLYPSSLLDSLFENLSDDKPNVLKITLYSVDNGYSIKISMKKNEPPVETFFSYADDTILSYVGNGELPPHLLEVLDKSEPRLFYNGCVIAEILDQQNGVPGELYRILLRPSNLSILNDVNQIIIENDQINWTYERRLKLESKLLLLYYPAMCMDMSPVAGLTVQLQHQMLSCRRVELNPLKKKQKTAKFECVAEDVSNDTFKQLLLQSKFSDVPRDSSKILVDHKMKSSVNLRKRKKEMPFISPKYFGFSNEDLEYDNVANSSSVGNSTVPEEISLDFDQISLSRECPTTRNSDNNQSLTKTMSDVSLSDKFIDLVDEKFDLTFAKNTSSLVPVTVSSMSNLIPAGSTISSPITLTRSAQSNLNLMATSIQSSKTLSTEENKNNLPILNNQNMCKSTENTKLSSAEMSIHRLECTEKINDISNRALDKPKPKMSTSNDIIKTSSETYFTQPSQSIKTLSVYKHVHGSGVCLKTKTPNLTSVLIQSVEQQAMTSHQSDYQNETSLDNIFNTDVADQPNLQIDVDSQHGASSDE